MNTEARNDTDEVVDVATAIGRDLVLPNETIINGIRYDAGVYRASLAYVGPVGSQDVEWMF